MIVYLPDPAVAPVGSVRSESDAVVAAFPVRDEAHREHLVALLEYAHDGDYAVEIKLVHYKGRPSRQPKAEPCDTERPTGDRQMPLLPPE